MSRKYIRKAIKQFVKERANHCCAYCQALELFATENFSIEHIFPLAKGGLNDVENLALACAGCNSRKFTKTDALDPETQTIVLIFHPRQQNWKDHFAWSDNSTTIIG